jgi:hypothetical protein
MYGLQLYTLLAKPRCSWFKKILKEGDEGQGCGIGSRGIPSDYMLHTYTINLRHQFNHIFDNTSDGDIIGFDITYKVST